jgi:hypothetical protein
MLDLVTVSYMTKYGRRPMHAFGGVALWFILPGVALEAYALVGGALLGLPTGGSTIPIVGAVMIASGVQCGLLGLTAEIMSQPKASHVPSVPTVRLESR